MTARVTVVIPTFRRPASLKRTLASVQQQTFADFRARVYDNASGDDTKQVVAEFSQRDPRFEYFEHPVNIGALANFIYGMQQVETPFFSFLSDDDFLYPNFFATGVRALEEHPAAMMFAGSTLELSAAGELLYAPVALWPREGQYDPPEGAWRMLDNRHPTWTSILFRHEVVPRFGLLDVSVGQPSDLDYELQIAAHCPIVISFEACAAYVRHDQANSVQEDASVTAGYRRMAEKFTADAALAPGLGKALAAALRRQAHRKLLEISVKSIVRGNDVVASDATRLLREDGGFAGALAAWNLALCMKLPVARRLLARAEHERLRLRARKAVRLTRTNVDGANLFAPKNP
jgi:glycosyltransferase involved in cell wall biosynthesis